MSDVQVTPVVRVEGDVRVPGDKAISHRALILGAMARGRSFLGNLSPAEDVASTAHCLVACGAELRPFGDSGGRMILDGAGLTTTLRAPFSALDCGNSGTTMRLLCGVLAGQAFDTELDGDSSLRGRPMRRVAEPLNAMGAQVDTSEGGTAPLHVEGRRTLRGIEHTLKVASAQVKSAILLAGLYADGATQVVEPAPTRDHTERLLRLCGIDVRERDGTIRMAPDALQPFGLTVPGDMSSAAAFAVLVASRPGWRVRLPGVGVNPGRTLVLDAIVEMGGLVEGEELDPASGAEPVADLIVSGASLRGITIAGDAIPRGVDELPLLALLATQAEGVTEIRDASELRHKESDRIAAVVAGLRAIGADCEEMPDGMRITGPTQLHGARLETHGDHRLAMTWAVAGCLADSATQIVNATCVDVSYPTFFQDLHSVVVPG